MNLLIYIVINFIINYVIIREGIKYDRRIDKYDYTNKEESNTIITMLGLSLIPFVGTVITLCLLAITFYVVHGNKNINKVKKQKKKIDYDKLINSILLIKDKSEKEGLNNANN